MRKKKNEITGTTEIEDVLHSAEVLYLALNAADAPYVLPLSYGFEPGRLYFHCAGEGRKLDLIRADNRVGFTVAADVRLMNSSEAGKPGNPCAFSVRYRSVVGTGAARIVDDPKEKIHGLQLIMDHYAPGDWQFPERNLAITTVVCIDVESLCGKKDE